jgi:hypothetical protein
MRRQTTALRKSLGHGRVLVGEMTADQAALHRRKERTPEKRVDIRRDVEKTIATQNLLETEMVGFVVSWN